MSDSMDDKSSETTASSRAAKSAADPWTVLRLLEWTTEFFRKQGSESPRLDAEILLAHARGCSRIELYTAFAEVPDDKQRIAFREMVRRRGEGMPVAQLVGYREFYSLQFRVDENVLIPRPETEHLVVEALDRAKELDPKGRPLRIADLGTGSGILAIWSAQAGADRVYAIEKEPVIKCAERLAHRNGLGDRITFIRGLFETVSLPEKVDVIVKTILLKALWQVRQLVAG